MTRELRTALGVVLSLAAGPAAAQRTLPAGQVVQGTLSFDAKATLGPFTGTTDSVTGAMTAGNDVREVRGWVEAPVASLVTGNGLRDKDLNKAMESERYPRLRFDLDGVSLLADAADSSQVMLSGRFTIHGVTREVAVPATVHYGTDGVRVRADFPMNVRDYGVTRLSKMFGAFKMNPNIVVHVDVLFGAAGRAPPASAPAATPPPTG